MKQSTFSAVMANSIKNLLQGYTKGIRFAAILTLLFTIGVGQMWGADKTETISWNTYTTSGTGATLTITWTANTSCTITQAKGDNTSNNVSTSYVTSPRWYQYHHITFTPKTGYTIKKVVLTGSGSSYNGQDMTFVAGSGTISKSGNATTITGAWTSSFKIKMGKQFRPGSVVVTYEEAATNFTVGETVFIQALSSSAWNDGACVKAWFDGNSTAATTYWLYDATGSDAGKKMFATIVPSGTSSKVQIQRFASNCSTWWNSNGDLKKSDGANTNILQTNGGGTNNVAWNSGGLQLYLYGTPNSWASSLATFSDKSNGVWTATYSNYSPTTTSADFKIKDSYNGWIGNTGSNNNATLSGMVVGSTYDITATLDITTHSLTISKELKKCKVHFNMNGHGSAIADKTGVTPNSTITAPTEPMDADYKFEGWYKESSCTNQWNFATDKVTETMTLYAKWTKKVSYTITWKVNNNDHLVGTPTTSIYEGSTYQDLTLPTDPEDSALDACYPQKVFVGWSTHELGYAETTEPDDLFTSDNVPDTEITADTTFYAVFATETPGTAGDPEWVATELADITATDVVVITSKNSSGAYYAMSNNNGTGSAPTATSVTVSNNKLSSTPNDNLKWNISNNSGTLTIYKNGSTSSWLYCTSTNNGVRVGTNMNNTFTIDSSTGYLKHTGTSRYLGVYNNQDWRCYTSTSTNIGGQTLKFYKEKSTASPASYSGYVSKCYCVTEIALAMTGEHKNLDVGETNQLLVTYKPEGATCDKEIVSWTSSNDNILSVSNTGLVTAQMAGTATITAKTAGGVTATYTITVNNPACEAWFLHYWNESMNGDECFYKVKPDDPNDHEWRTGNFSLPSNSDEDKFNVNNANGGDPTYKKDQIFRTGIGFADIQRGGQNCGTNPYPGQDAYGQLSIYDDSKTSNRYIAFYPAQYLVTYGKEGAASWEVLQLNNTTGYEYESEPFMVPNGYKTDDTYKYWVGITKHNGSILYVEGKSSVDAMNTVSGLSDADMAGKWGVWHIWSNSCANNWYGEFIRYYRVDFDLNDGEGYIAPRYGKATTPYVTFSTTDITAPTRDGYTFLGWKDQKGNSYNPTESTVTINDDLTLTAQWAKHHTVTYDANEGTTRCEDDNIYIEGDEVKVCADQPTRTGYTFDGWIRSDNGERVKEGETFTMPDEDVTLTAQWIRNTYAITWIVAGEETTIPLGTGEALSSIMPDDPTSCSDTYTTFVGWYTAASGMETSPSAEPQGEQVTASTVPTANATYYAVWADAAAGGGEWEKVISFEIGDVVIFVNETSSKEMSDINLISSNTCGIASSYTTNPVGTYPLTIEAGNNETGYSFKTSDNKYLSWSSGNTLIKSETKNDASSWTIHSNTDGNFKFANIGTAERIMQYNTSSPRWACYTSGQTAFQIYKQASSATGYISSCCQSPAVVTVTPADASLELNIDGTASTTVNISQTGGGNGKYYEPTVSPVDGASLNWATLGVDHKKTAYNIDFIATKAGTYTVTGNFTETTAGCPKYGSATINVVANPILQASAEALEFSPTCGQNSASQEVEINSRYLTSNSITAIVATTSGSGKFTISTDNTTFGTSNLTLSGGTTTKVTDQIYVRYEAEEGETGAVAGTLTLKCGTTQQVINLTGTCTCSANVTITGAPIQITAAKGVWVEAATELTVTGTFLTTNADNANVTIRAYTNNAAFQIKKGGVTGEGAPKTASNNALTLNTDGAISTADWTGNIAIVYKPTQANTTETATLTIEVYRHNGSTIYSTATYELEGRSLPEQFVIAVTNGSGDWFAVPADMVAPWGNACTGLGTFAPYPISVDNTTAPTVANDVPARAVYQAAARTGNVNTNPQTMSYKSVPLGGNYYLYGSSTSVESDGSNTNIQNASFAASEKQKWFLDVVDWNTKQYHMHLHSDLTTSVLAYTTAGGANRVGQYSATAGTTKKSIYLLPINGTTCTYYAAPVVIVMAIDATNATIQFKNDRTTAYEISLDQNTWTDLAVTLIKDCNNSEEATLLQAQLPLATYRGKTVYIRAKVTTGTACQETGSFVVPNPTINRGETPWRYTGMAGQAFSDNSKSVTINDLWNPLSVSVVQQVTGSNIQASITPEGVVTVSMAAEDATEGDHKAVLEFTSAGAETKQVGVVITLHNLAMQEFDGGDAITFTETSPIMLCKNAIDENAATPTIYLAYPLYDADGTAISTTDQLNQTSFSLVDLSTGAAITAFSRVGSIGGVAKITFSASTLSEMVPGHTYRLSWENTNQVMTNADGLPYMDCHIDFVYSENCDAPTALAACPITNSGFTANWVGDVNCTGNVTVDVYTRGAGTTLIDKTTFSTTEVNDLQYAGESNLSGNYWITNIEGTKGGAPSISSNRLLISDVSTPKYYNLFSPLLSNLGTINESTIYTITVTLYQQTSDAGAGAYFYVMDNGNNLTKNTTPTITNKSVTIDGQTATSKKLTYGTTTFTVKGLSSDDRIRFLGFESSSIASNKKNVYISSIKIESSGSIVPVATKTTSCNAGSAEFTGLSSNTTYYYTVSDGTNTSNEIAVTTYTNNPVLKFYSDEACTNEITETTVLGGEETVVYVKGTEVPGCGIEATVSTGYGMDDSGINYTTGTGAVTGSIVLTLTNSSTTEGTLTLTDGEGGTYTLHIISSDCPAGFATMALPATNITNESAQANWTTTLDFGDDKNGTLHLYKNGIVNRELIVNGDFETGSLADGWSNGINKGEVGGAHSFDQYTIKNNSEAHDGNYSLYVTADGSELTNFQGQSVMYADYITLTPGTYRMSAWVKMPTVNGYNDKTQYFSLGIITGKNGSEHVYTVSTPVTVYSNNTYVQLTHEFEVTSTITACPAIGASSGTFRDFYLDDVSLVCTSIGQGDEPYLSIDIADLSADGNLALTDLSGNTEYTYVIQNADGCSSNPITFTTTDANAPVITPNDVAISCQVGGSVNGIMTLTVKDVYGDIYISNSCTERITLKTTQLPKEGGVVNFTFTPLTTDEGGTTGTCIISFTTKGMSTPAEGVITWTVTAGKDPNQPNVEVVDITNESMDIEHNQGDDNNVHIVISREKGEDEIEENLGEEIFFSKYYEAYMHKKLWAIYNPTNHPISLANTYVWRSNGKSTEWNTENGLDLSGLGNIEPGYIHPNEEIIIYTADQVGACEQSKADMSDWVAMSSNDPALSFSGDDALLLVRKDVTGDADNPPTESVELDSNGDPYPLSWKRYTDAGGQQWWMLDIIGARKNDNTPDNSATHTWNWTCNGKTETGDAAGWVGTGEHLDATLYTDCPYVLSTNRCLLIRKMTVKSGYKAILNNVGDMQTLNTEWRGAHVPRSGDQEAVSCENFSFVGGYDYDSYYNAWTPIDEMDYIDAVKNDDGSYTISPINMPQYYCHPLRIEVYITENINGEDVNDVKAYIDYKVPIVVDYDTDTSDPDYFSKPTDDNVLTDAICAECDVVVRDAAKLTHVNDGRAEFRTMQVYPTGRLDIPEGLTMQLEGLQMYAKNDEVGYAIINGSTIEADNIVHIKRINDMYWYPFSLPYDCKVSSIYQLNGKSMGEYWTDWGIKYYDGEARQQMGDNYVGGETSAFWKKLEPDQTLKANQGYIIGLFTTEYSGQMKSVYFPPVESTKYSENAGSSKTTYISNWPDNLTCEPRHRGWNFTGLPYISLFSSQNGDGTTNNNSLMMGSQADDYATSSIVYVSIPDGGDSRTYTQVSAASVKLEPFKPYFVQAMDPIDGQSHDDIALTYSKEGRTLDKIQARSAASTQATIMVELVVANQDATLTDNAGVLVNDRYTENYEIAADLMKMYAEDRKPQLFTRSANNEMMAYNALPDHLAQNIPLGLFVPTAGEYTISILEYASQLADAEAAYLLYEGEIVANLLYSDYTIVASQRGQINGYSLDIRRKKHVTTSVDNLLDGGVVIVGIDGKIIIDQLPANASVQIMDVLGRVLYQQANVPEIITFQAPVTGVYNVVITTEEQHYTQKTIIR